MTPGQPRAGGVISLMNSNNHRSNDRPGTVEWGHSDAKRGSEGMRCAFHSTLSPD